MAHAVPAWPCGPSSCGCAIPCIFHVHAARKAQLPGQERPCSWAPTVRQSRDMIGWLDQPGLSPHRRAATVRSRTIPLWPSETGRGASGNGRDSRGDVLGARPPRVVDSGGDGWSRPSRYPRARAQWVRAVGDGRGRYRRRAPGARPRRLRSRWRGQSYTLSACHGRFRARGRARALLAADRASRAGRGSLGRGRKRLLDCSGSAESPLPPLLMGMENEALRDQLQAERREQRQSAVGFGP